MIINLHINKWVKLKSNITHDIYVNIDDDKNSKISIQNLKFTLSKFFIYKIQKIISKIR